MADTVFADPIPAATLVLFRHRQSGPPELLIVERSSSMAFAGGALVFPGGRIDPGDRALALRDLPDDPHGAAKVAAIRETIEEAGIAVGLEPLPDVTMIANLRRALHEGDALAPLIDAAELRIDGDALGLYARWCPRHANMRIFDTLFFVAELPKGAPDPDVDGTENSRAFWMSAADVLDLCARGEASIIFPTRRNLERLALHEHLDDAIADARRHGVRTVTPWTEMRDGIEHLCIPDDLGYPVTAEPLTGTRRA